MDHAGRRRRSLLWLALSALFALYVTFAGSYSRTAGALATGIILLLWLNYTVGDPLRSGAQRAGQAAGVTFNVPFSPLWASERYV
jgi:hypothetical protein